ncbi:HipA domain-containing protein [Cellulosimicrobium cellulans]
MHARPRLRRSTPRPFADLLRLVTCNTIVGNGDAHAKNYSLLVDTEASYSVAPLYDAAPVHLVSSAYRHSGLAVAGRNRLDHVTGALLVEEAVSWGMGRATAVETIASVADAVLHGLDAVPADVPHAQVPKRVAERATAVARSATAARAAS